MEKLTSVYTSGDLRNKINETIDELGNIQTTTDSNLTLTASTQSAITPTSSKSDQTVTLNIPNVATGIAAGSYTLKSIIQELMNKSHTHSTTAVTFTDDDTITSDNCTSANSCTSNNDCH